MEIIGHKSARRVHTSDGWLYETPENHALAVKCAIFLRGASLPDLDNFIEGIEEQYKDGEYLQLR